MTTDEEKTKISKLLQGVEVQETRLSERCYDLVKEFHNKFDKEVEEEEQDYETENKFYENPYKPDQSLLKENERKLRELLSERKRSKRQPSENVPVITPDPKRPWRTNSNQEKIHRIDNELKMHLERSTQLIVPLPESKMKELVQECREETKVALPVGMARLRETVETAKKVLPNFQYRKISNTTATAIMTSAHDILLKPQE